MVLILTDVEREWGKRGRERESARDRGRKRKGESKRENGSNNYIGDIVMRVDYSIFLISLLNGICTIMKKIITICRECLFYILFVLNVISTLI